jgi:hypothetical protein
MTRLSNLQPGEKFIWNNIKYTVMNHEGAMTEVFGNNRSWAWPLRSYVKKLS